MKTAQTLVQRLIRAMNKKKIREVLYIVPDESFILCKVIFNDSTSWQKRFHVLNHIQLNYPNVLVTMNTENNLIIRKDFFANAILNNTNANI